MKRQVSNLFSILFVALLVLTSATAGQAADYRYDPALAKALLSEAGVRAATQALVVDYLDARESTHAQLAANFSPAETHLYMMELESRERTYQALHNALGKRLPLGPRTKAFGALQFESAQVEVTAIPLSTLIDELDALSVARQQAYAFFIELGAGSDTLSSMKAFDVGLSGLAALAEVTGQSGLFGQYFAGTISGTDFLANLSAGAPAHLWEGSMAEFEPMLDAFVDEYDNFTDSFSSSFGADAQVFYDYLDNVAQSQIDVSKAVAAKHLEPIRTGNDLERDLTLDLVQMGSRTSFTKMFSYFDQRRGAYAAVLGEVGGEAATNDLFEEIEYVLEQWEIDLAKQNAAIRDDDKLHQMDAFDDSVGDVLAAMINLGYSQFNPYDGMTLEEAVAALNEQATTAQALADEAEANQDDEDWMKKTKEILRKIKKVKVVIPLLKIALKKELEEETMKEVCKWIKIACVILKASCAILDILCEDKVEGPVDELPQDGVFMTPEWISNFQGRIVAGQRA